MGPQQETKYTTSFIPKKPVSMPKADMVRRSGPGLITTISFFIFLLSLLGVVLVYGWTYQLNTNITKQISDLKAYKDSFDENTIKEATILNDKIIAVNDILNNHKAPSNLFDVLERTILETVKLNTLSYQSTEDGSINISGSGLARGFESVVLQSDEFGLTRNFKDVIFSGVQTSDRGVSFSMTASLDPQIVLYRKNFSDSISGLDKFDESAESASAKTVFKNIFK
jgi:hypothetical protein